MQKNKILHFDFELTNEERKVFGKKETVTLYKNGGEGMPHIIMKLLAYFWFYHPDLKIEKAANQNWKPDLVRFDLRGEPVQWIDCGETKRHKLDRISTRNKKTNIHIVKKSQKELLTYKEVVERTLRHPERVKYFAPDLEFVDALEKLIFGRHKLIVTVLGELDFIYLDIDGVLLESKIHKV